MPLWGWVLIAVFVAGAISFWWMGRDRKPKPLFPTSDFRRGQAKSDDLGDIDPSGGVRRKRIPPTLSASAEEKIPYDNTTN